MTKKMKVLVCLLFTYANCLVDSSASPDQITAKLDSLVVPSLNFSDTPLADALSFIQQKSVELDPEKEGINVVILEPQLRDKLVTLKLTNATLHDVLRYTTMLAGAHLNKTRFAVTITSPPDVEVEAEEIDTEKIEAKLRDIVIPSVEFAESPLIDALDFLGTQSGEIDPSDGGVNIIYLGDRESSGQTRVNLKLSNVPLYETLKYTIQIAGHEFRIEPNAIVVAPMFN